MKLIVSRGQSDVKGLLGGHKGVAFNLTCRVTLTPQEEELIKRYKVEGEVLTWRDGKKGSVPGETIGSFLRGVRFETQDIGSLLNNEEVIRDACTTFKGYLEVMRTFGGEEVVEI